MSRSRKVVPTQIYTSWNLVYKTRKDLEGKLSLLQQFGDQVKAGCELAARQEPAHPGVRSPGTLRWIQ